MHTQPQRILEAHRLGEQSLAGPKRQSGAVVTAQVQQVEQVVEDGHIASPGLVGVRGLHAWLQAGEARTAALECHDLAVDHRIGREVHGHGIDQLRVGRAERFAVA